MNILKNLYSSFVRMRRSQEAGPSNFNPPPKLFEMNDDCFNEIFEYLCMKDLHSFGQTCKRMNNLAGEYFKRNHLTSSNECRKDGIDTLYYEKGNSSFKTIKTPGFNNFNPRISICLLFCFDFEFGSFKYLKSHISEFESTKKLYLSRINCINKRRVECFKKLLPQLEIVRIKSCSVDGDFYKLILKYCQNLRGIYVESSDVNKRKNGKLNWLLQKYPHLECLHWVPRDCGKIEELREFFEYTPTVRIFSTYPTFFLDNGDILLNSNAKLDTLILNGRCTSYSRNLFELLNQLHDQGFYKRLHIYTFEVSDDFLTMFSLVKNLEFLNIGNVDKKYNYIQFTNLREIYIPNVGYPRVGYGRLNADIEDFEVLAHGLKNLERLWLSPYHEFDAHDIILAFIRRSLKLTKIRFDGSIQGGVLNLTMLNEERAKLSGARKITIYVRDDIFLATKWTTRNGDTNLRFIEMRRDHSFEWDPYYFR